MTFAQDTASLASLQLLADDEGARVNRVAGVRTILIILSATGIVYDVEALRQKTLLSYPDSTVFFQSTQGQALGAECPSHVDLLIDFTGPGQRQGVFHAKKLRRMVRVAVGRNAGWFRKRIYDRVFEEASLEPSTDSLGHERRIQHAVLTLAGVAMTPVGDALPDRGSSLPRELPPMQRL